MSYPATSPADQALVQRYRSFAAYNRWANARLYAAAARLTSEQFRADQGAFFGSVHGTLNHLLATDRIWLWRLTGLGDAPDRLDAILFDDIDELTRAREAEDARFMELTDSLNAERLLSEATYPNMTGARFAQPLWTVLDHIFNHQTHHRGQVHTLLTILLGPAAAPSMDLVALQRDVGIARSL